MKIARIDPKTCCGEEECLVLKACPVEAVRRKEDGKWEIDFRRCLGCGRCVQFCRCQAVSI